MFIGLKFNYNIHLKTIKSILTTVCIGSNGSFTSLINNFLRSLITLFNTFIYLISIFFLFHREYFPYVCFASSDLLGLSSSFFFELFPKIVHRQCQFDIRNEIFSFFSSPHFSFVFFRCCVLNLLRQRNEKCILKRDGHIHFVPKKIRSIASSCHIKAIWGYYNITLELSRHDRFIICGQNKIT